MKLVKLPPDLPIEAIHDVTSLLGTLVAGIKNRELFIESKSFADFHETIQNLQADIHNYYHMYEDWQDDPNSEKFADAFMKMRTYLIEAEALLHHATPQIH